MRAVYLFTTDLRLSDNKGLKKALKEAGEINFSYIYPQNINEWGASRRVFLESSLESVSKKLRNFGHELSVVSDLEELKVDRVYLMSGAENLVLIENLRELELEVICEESTLMHAVEKIPFKIEDLPFMFTEYRKKIEEVDLKSWNEELDEINEGLFKNTKPLDLGLEAFEKLTSKSVTQTLFVGGEEEGLRRLESYFSNPDLASTYKETRNGMLNFSDSTKFSPWLALGCLSPNRILRELIKFEEEFEANDSTYWIYFELLWRDFFKLSHLKHGVQIKDLNGFRSKSKYKVSCEDEELFTNWKNGETGNDFIDANMRELKTTGWMSNRGRQNVSNYFCHEIGLDWRLGAYWFEVNLIDYDEASNWGNWAYQAGVGHDGRVRRFNTSKQAEMYDPDSKYRDKFLKE